MTLKQMRKEYSLSQIEASTILGIPERTYRRYETDEGYGSVIKRMVFVEMLRKHCEITEEKGLLSLEAIKKTVTQLLEQEYKGEVDCCYLFGSYAKGLATPISDVDLYVSASLSGLRFVGLIERLRQALHKKVDLIRDSELNNNIELVKEILKTGIKIYG